VGEQSSLAFATPRSGYETEINDTGPGKIDVRFEAEERESRVVVSCEAGTPSPQIREHDD
jgi:hypothetical protein